jgi:deazaflavin-dependent oxidoreductase (nitroreductase family)
MDLHQYLTDIGLKTMSRAHRAIVHLSGGQVLGSAFGMPVAELHTVGRRSGRPRSTMLTAPVVDGDRVVLVASKGGDDRDPDWYRNLVADPAGPPGVAGGEGGVVASGGGGLPRLRQLPAPYRARHPAGHLRAALNAYRGPPPPLLHGGFRRPVLRALCEPIGGKSARTLGGMGDLKTGGGRAAASGLDLVAGRHGILGPFCKRPG